MAKMEKSDIGPHLASISSTPTTTTTAAYMQKQATASIVMKVAYCRWAQVSSDTNAPSVFRRVVFRNNGPLISVWSLGVMDGAWLWRLGSARSPELH